MAKHKYLSNFDCFSLHSDTFFGLLDCAYTHLYTQKICRTIHPLNNQTGSTKLINIIYLNVPGKCRFVHLSMLQFKAKSM